MLMFLVLGWYAEVSSMSQVCLKNVQHDDVRKLTR